MQGPEHPHPGKRFSTSGFPRVAYLPDTPGGQKVSNMYFAEPSLQLDVCCLSCKVQAIVNREACVFPPLLMYLKPVLGCKRIQNWVGIYPGNRDI